MIIRPWLVRVELARLLSHYSVRIGCCSGRDRHGQATPFGARPTATIGLEGYVDALNRLPDHHAWNVLRDLADVAAAIPYLDHDLSEVVGRSARVQVLRRQGPTLPWARRTGTASRPSCSG